MSRLPQFPFGIQATAVRLPLTPPRAIRCRPVASPTDTKVSRDHKYSSLCQPVKDPVSGELVGTLSLCSHAHLRPSIPLFLKAFCSLDSTAWAAERTPENKSARQSVLKGQMYATCAICKTFLSLPTASSRLISLPIQSLSRHSCMQTATHTHTHTQTHTAASRHVYLIDILKWFGPFQCHLRLPQKAAGDVSEIVSTTRSMEAIALSQTFIVQEVWDINSLQKYCVQMSRSSS
ncbi:unnamed protein product [Protopolystoma xenopodis]|uniref:Uncharacterized protein n=1 Tax=Protopolystoma xenopodis TaxID=117903 RepID=A0A448X8I9_9PLAT|nr:unnamed protein product [Protopolystoma xenopodis]